MVAAVTSGMLAARRRAKPPPAAKLPVVPAQREKIIEGGAEFCVADQEAEDNRILALIDRL